MTYHNMPKTNLSTHTFLEKVGSLKARYFVYAVVGIIPILSLIANDHDILLGVEHGNLDVSSLSNLIFPFHSTDAALLVYRILFGVMVALAGFAIFIRVAQSKTHDDVRESII